MTLRFVNLWQALRSSLWFVPALILLGALVLSVVLIALDKTFEQQVIEHTGWIWAGGHDGAREVLSTIASSMITVAGVVFSITIVALQLASSQFGPRLLRNFMRDTGNQVVLGTFIATFLYCLLVLRTVRGGNGEEFVPYIAVTVAMALVVGSLGVLIYFIHHVSVSIQAASVIASVGHELEQAIERLFPEKLGRGEGEGKHPKTKEQIPGDCEDESYPVEAASSGYVQFIDEETLMRIAKEHDFVLQLPYRPGQFVERGSTLVLAWPGERVDEPVAEQLHASCKLGAERTLTQDVEFAVDQLVEVAVRALSPGTNDPFTALRCIDRLGAALAQLAERRIPSPYRYDDTGTLRVIASPVTFAEVTDAAFNNIRQYGRASVAVMIRLLERIAVIATHATRQEDRAALLHHALLIEQDSQESVPNERDRKDIIQRFRGAARALEQQSTQAEGARDGQPHGSPPSDQEPR